MSKIRSLLSLLSIVILVSLLTGCCEEDEYDTETSITYTLTLSPDLLKYVTPQVSYVDENGVLVKVTGVQELDDLVIENSAEISGKGYSSSSWSKQVVTGTGYKAWTLNMKFRHLNFHSYMGVKYIKNELSEDPIGNLYNFHHSINTSVAAVKYIKTTEGNTTRIDQSQYADSYVTVSLNFKQGDNVGSYIDNLINTPDKIGFYVDDKGDVSRRAEFDL